MLNLKGPDTGINHVFPIISQGVGGVPGIDGLSGDKGDKVRNTFFDISGRVCETFANVFVFFCEQGETGVAGHPGLPGPAGLKVRERGLRIFNPVHTHLAHCWKDCKNSFDAGKKKISLVILVLAVISETHLFC